MKKLTNKYKDFDVDVLGDSWRVEFKHPVKNDNNIQAMGLCDYEAKKIFVDFTLSKKEAEHTLIHEFFHAYVRSGGVANAQISYDLEEIIADQFAKVLIANFDFKF